jgi:hypothetical protein
MMEAARTSETLINFYQTTWRYNPEDAIFVLTAVRTSNPTALKLLNEFNSGSYQSDTKKSYFAGNSNRTSVFSEMAHHKFF